MNISEIDDFVLYAKSRYIVRYDMNKRDLVRIQLNGMKNVISVDYDYAGKTLIYADITQDRIMKMNLTTGKTLDVSSHGLKCLSQNTKNKKPGNYNSQKITQRSMV